MKNSIDYNDIFDIMITKIEMSLAKKDNTKEQQMHAYGGLSVLKALRDISEGDIHEYHAEIAKQLIKVRSVVAKM